jgi:hypothetical protein
MPANVHLAKNMSKEKPSSLFCTNISGSCRHLPLPEIEDKALNVHWGTNTLAYLSRVSVTTEKQFFDNDNIYKNYKNIILIDIATK